MSEVVGVGSKPDPDAGSSDSPPQTLLSKARAWRFPPFETYPGLVAFAQTSLGKVVVLVVFAFLLHRLNSLWIPVTVAAGACAYAGQYRSRVVMLGTLCVLLLNPGWIDWAPATLVGVGERVEPQIVSQLNRTTIALFFVLSAAALYCVRRWMVTRSLADQLFASMELFSSCSC